MSTRRPSMCHPPISGSHKSQQDMLCLSDTLTETGSFHPSWLIEQPYSSEPESTFVSASCFIVIAKSKTDPASYTSAESISTLGSTAVALETQCANCFPATAFPGNKPTIPSRSAIFG